MKETVKKTHKDISDDDDDNDYDKREKKETRSDKHDKKSTLLHIYVTTSNLPNAGTNANVFLQLYKTKRIDATTTNNKKQPSLIESLKFPLENLKSSSPPSTKKFQPGHTDLFEIEDDSFDAQHDQLERIRVSTDARPFVNAGWHLKRIVIRVPSNDDDQEEKDEYTFECGQWLDALEAKDKKTQRDLYPTETRKSKTKKTNSKDKETRDNFLLFNKVKENRKRSKDEFDDESHDSSFESDSRSDDRDRSSSRQSVDSHRRNSSKK